MTFRMNVSPPWSGSWWMYSFKSWSWSLMFGLNMEAPGTPRVLIPMYHMLCVSDSPSTRQAYPLCRICGSLHSP